MSLCRSSPEDSWFARYPCRMPTEIVQVQLVSQWWDDPLSITAILLSLGTLTWTIWERRRNQAQLKVVAVPSMFLAPFNQWFLSVDVQNIGRTDSTIVSSVSIEFPSGERLHQISSPLPHAVDLPTRIDPGGSFSVVFDIVALAGALNDRDLNPEKIRAIADSGHGKGRGKLSKMAIKMVHREMIEQRQRTEA